MLTSTSFSLISKLRNFSLKKITIRRMMKRLTNKPRLLKLISYRRDLACKHALLKVHNPWIVSKYSSSIQQFTEGHQRKSILTWSVIKIYLNFFFCSIRSFGFCYFLDFKDLEAVPSVRREKSFFYFSHSSSAFDPDLKTHLSCVWMENGYKAVGNGKSLLKCISDWGAWKVCLQTEARANSE